MAARAAPRGGDHPGAQPATRVKLLLEQIAAALDHAHGDGLIHRDIKPANIVLFLPHRHGGQAEQVKLLDFGLVIRSPESADARSDLCAVGAVAYDLLSGRHVFRGGTVIEVCGQHLHAAPQPQHAGLGCSSHPGMVDRTRACAAPDGDTASAAPMTVDVGAPTLRSPHLP